MAWAERLPNGKWRAIWRDEQGRKRSQAGIASKPAALRLAGEQEAKSRRGESVTGGRAPTWGEWSVRWLELRRVEASTKRQDTVRIRRYLTPRWGSVRINRITRSDVQAWVNELALTNRYDGTGKREPQPLAGTTVARIFHLFSASMKAAAIDPDVPVSKNPCVNVSLPDPTPGHERFLERAEFDLIAHHLNNPYKAAASVLVGCGLRFGEMAGLHWQRVDLEHALIDVVETWEPALGAIKAYPKGKQRRAVQIPTWLMPILTGLLDEQGEPAKSCGIRHAGGARCRSGLVVPRTDGGPLDAHNFGQREWSNAVKMAGVDHCTLHDLRHTYASWLVQAGVPITTIQALLGHGSITTTMRYAHLGTSQDEIVRAAIG